MRCANCTVVSTSVAGSANLVSVYAAELHHFIQLCPVTALGLIVALAVLLYVRCATAFVGQQCKRGCLMAVSSNLSAGCLHDFDFRSRHCCEFAAPESIGGVSYHTRQFVVAGESVGLDATARWEIVAGDSSPVCGGMRAMATRAVPRQPFGAATKGRKR